MKTIVMEIFAAIENNVHLNPDGPNWEELKNETLAKEKEHIMNFCWECLRGDNIHTITSNKELIEYINNKYNQTYNQNK
jgi:hypothetical protein